MENEEFETFDFLINDEDEVMLLLYEREGEPNDPRITLNSEDGSAVLYRNAEDSLLLSDISSDIFDSLSDADKLLVCELSRTENDDDAEIVSAYEADIAD